MPGMHYLWKKIKSKNKPVATTVITFINYYTFCCIMVCIVCCLIAGMILEFNVDWLYNSILIVGYLGFFYGFIASAIYAYRIS